MAKPVIMLSGPPILFAGGKHEIGIEITAEEALKLDYVEAELLARQGWAVGAGKSRVTHRIIYPRLVSRLMGQGVMAAGPNRFTMAFRLPSDLPPTHQTEPAWATLELRVRLAVPWWFDHRYHFYLQMRVPPPPVVTRTPIVMRSTAASEPVDKPRIEVSLSSTRLVIGETVQGSVAVFHLDDKKPREVDLQLIPNLKLIGRGFRERTGGAHSWRVTIPAGAAGQAIPFQIAMPRTAVPSFASATHIMSWVMKARSGSFFGGKVSLAIPLELVDETASATAERLTQTPRLADERIAATFARFAGTRDWQGQRLGDQDDDDARLAIERDCGSSSLRLTYAYRDDGTFLVSRIATPSLGLGLSVTPSSALRHVFWKDIEVEIATWDRDHYVTARSADQTIPALKAVVPTLTRLTALGTLIRWTDDAMVYERAVSNVEEEDLASCESALEAIAAVIDVARLAVTPPPEIAIELAAWRELAHSLGGELGIGDLSIEGKLGHVPVTVGLVFDSDDHHPVALVAAAGDPEHASAAARAIKLELARPATDALASTQLNEVVVDQLTRWPTDVTELRVEDGVATARWRIPAVAPGQLPEVNAARAKDLVHGLAAVLTALDPGAGPYR